MKQAEHQLALTAYHEAGHAVAAFERGVPVHHASIIPTEGTKGHIRHATTFRRSESPEWDTSPRNRIKAERAVIIAFAGGIAQRHRFPRSHVGDERDLANAVDVIEYFARSEEHLALWLRTLRQEAKDLITGEQWWPVVEALAAKLMEQRQMRRAEIEECIHAAIGGGA
jgi:hypothetical protein